MLDILKLLEARTPGLDCLKNCILGGASLDSSLTRRIQLASPKLVDVHNAYGSTKLSLCATLVSRNDPREKIFGTNGRVLDHLECKITDTLTGNVLAHNLRGELWIRGWSVMTGYHDDADKTKDAITASRWYRTELDLTRDIAIMDHEGFITVVDRCKDVIIRGGENVYPKEIENYLMENPSIIEAYVFGIPDKRLGEQVCAWIKIESNCRDPLPQEIRERMKQKIAYFKVPKHIFIVKDIPLTGTFKPSKSKMKEITMERLPENSS